MTEEYFFHDIPGFQVKKIIVLEMGKGMNGTRRKNSEGVESVLDPYFLDKTVRRV